MVVPTSVSGCRETSGVCRKIGLNGTQGGRAYFNQRLQKWGQVGVGDIAVGGVKVRARVDKAITHHRLNIRCEAATRKAGIRLKHRR